MTLDTHTVLVVDDDALIREILSQQLEDLGVRRVMAAESAADALDLLRRHPEIDTVLTDINMPGMDGPLFLRQLADMHCSARIVLISGVSNEIIHSTGELARAHGLHIIGFIQKPASAAALQALIDGQPSAARAPRAPHAQSAIDLSPERLRAAIESREVRPWYQPKVESGHLRVIGAEALARWQLPGGQLISPGEFVPAMEAAGLSSALFFRILEQVLHDLERWQELGMSLKASVNLSMDCAHELDLPERLLAVFSGRRVMPADVVIEVTESRLMSDRSAAMETLTRLSLMGFRLSIDDFGTGYSSLSQLADLPFAELKVDGSFVRRAGSDFKANAILQTTVTFGRSLGMDVVAEGVETFDQVDLLRRTGAPILQGYLIGKPMPAASFTAWLERWRPGFVDRPGCTRTLSLLVVDDSPSMCRVIENALQKRIPESRIYMAANAEEAEKLVAAHTIDGTTLDFYMPGIDGLQLLKRLRDRCPAAHHVMLTSNLSEELAREVTALGAMYCPKPFTEHQAERIVRHFLQEVRARDSVAGRNQ